MRFIVGPIPEECDFMPFEAGWHAQKELSSVQLLVLSVPIAFLTGLLCLWLYKSLVNPAGLPINVNLIYVSFIVLLPIHEIVHAIATPNWGLSNKTVVGFWPKRMLPYCAYLGEWTRSQALWCLLAPIFILSIFPMILMFMFRLDNSLLFHFFAVNALASSGDLIQAPMILLCIPQRAILKNKGWRTYWKET